MPIASMMPSSHLILWHSLFLPSIFPGIRNFSSESTVHIRWPKYWSFSFIISLSNEQSRLISLKIDWFDTSDKYPELGLLNHMVVLFLIFWGNCIQFSKVAAPIYIINSAQGFPFLHIFTNICYILSIWQWPFLTGVRWYLIVVSVYTPWWLLMLSSLPCTCWPSVCLCKNVYSGSLPTF